jgi:DNA mismatch repair protein MSH6
VKATPTAQPAASRPPAAVSAASAAMGKAEPGRRQASIMAFFGPPSTVRRTPVRTPAPAPTPPTVVRDGEGPSQDSSDLSPVVSVASPGDAAKRKLFANGSAGRVLKRPLVATDEIVEIDIDAPGGVPAVADVDDEEEDAVVVARGRGKVGGGRKLRRVADIAEEAEEERDGKDDVEMDTEGKTAAVADFASQFARGCAPQAGDPRARRVLDALDLSGGHMKEEGGWCDKNTWSVDVRDSEKRAKTDEGYDPSTLYIPRGVLERMSPFQRQFWDLKSRYYDTMLFVKKGAFMEAYDIDADIVHSQLGLNYTGGGRASMRCAGVPEGSLNKHAARLIDLGYKVGIVAQTETANMSDKRKASAGGAATSKVCHRSLIRILTRATVTDDELLRDHRARYVIAVREADRGTVNAAGEIVVGVCHVDAASGRITVGEFLDDNRRSWTEKLLSTLRPPELIVPVKEQMSDRMRALVRWAALGATPVDVMHREDNEGFPAMTDSWLEDYVGEGGAPSVQRGYFDKHPRAARAFGAVASYLNHLMIDKEILSLGNYTVLPPIRARDSVLYDGDDADACENGDLSTQAVTVTQNAILATGTLSDVDDGYDPARAVSGGLQMDAATMANLEVLVNVVDGSERGALISVIDRAATPSGRRLLRRWIADPLSLSAAINDRLNAVETLMRVGDETLSSVRRSFASGPDLERALPRLHQFAVVPDGSVMFDDTNARRVKEFVKVLRAMETSLDGLECLGKSLPPQSSARRLAWLLTAGEGYAKDTRKKLDFFFKSCFDVQAAEMLGEITPKAGGAPKYDAAKLALDEVEDKLDNELQRWRNELGDKSVKFYHRGKETHQLEIKAATIDRTGVSAQFTPSSESKSVKRFYTNAIQSLIKRHVDAAESHQEASVNVLRDIVLRFDENRALWSDLVKVSAEVDALIGLAIASQGDGTGPMTRPVVLPDSHPEPVFETKEMRHPVLAAKAGASFVSNDTALGDGRETIALVTGSNCSGKSTLSRQVAVSVILAQIGAFVPAKLLRLRPFVSLFARAGSRDEIARGRSTFMVEMEEAALIVNTATHRSLVIVDELCSGTTAQDAHAISNATLDRLLELKCLTIFCTHADALAIEFAGRVGNYTMAAEVDEETRSILFLYKLVEGITSRSRGVFCARVAGIPSAVADEAEGVAQKFDDTLTAKRDLSLFVKLAGQSCDESIPVAALAEHLRACASVESCATFAFGDRAQEEAT